MSAPDGSRSAALIASDSSDSRFTVDNESEVPYEEVEPIENLNESFEGLPEINEGDILDSDGYGTKEINPNENFAFNNTENLSEQINAPKISNYSLSQAQEIFGISESDDEDLYNISSEEEISGMSDFIEDDEFGDDEVNKNNARIVVSSDNESDLSEADHPKPAKKPKMVSSHSKKASLSEKFMPDELEKHFLSLKQQVVALKDIPERYLSDDLVLMGEISSNNIENEAEWIFNSYFGKQILSKSIKMPFVDQKKSLIAKIVNSLEMMKHQHLDIPFIWHYRSEFVRPELSIEYLWKIFEYDRQWLQFILKKNKAFELCKALIELENSRLLKNDNQKSRIKYRRADSSLLMMVENISSMTDLSDFNGYINFYFPHLLLEISSEKEFKALKSSKFFYTLCSENRLTELLPYFGLTPKQLAENLNENYSINHINQSDYSLESLAIKYVNKRFPSVEMISATVIRLLAMEIAIEPTILNYFRKVFSTRGVVNIKPTKKGISEIDNNHPCNKFKYIANKPMKCFDKEEFLECYIQEKIGNLVISIDVNTESNNRSEKSLYLEILQHFQWDKFNAITKSWNKHREEVIKIAVNMILLPKIALELKGKMIEESKEYVLRGYAANLTRLVTQKPFDFSSAQEDKSNNENQISAKDLLDKISSPTIMTFVYSLDDSDKSAMATFCDHYGNFIEYIILPNFHYGPKSSKTKIETKAEDVKTLKEFIKMHMPRVVLVACSSSKASSFHYELKVILSRLATEDQQFSLIKLFYIDVKVGLGYYNSNLALEEYKNLPTLARFSISLTRFFLDPLTEVCHLFDPNDTQCPLMSIQLHRLQNELDISSRHSMAEKTLCTEVNSAGVSIKKILESEYHRCLLKYISGLGHLKSLSIIKSIKKMHNEGKNLCSRADLVNELHLGPYIFVNCSGFLKFCYDPLARKKSHMKSLFLDQTRIHPESYHWAIPFSQDILQLNKNDVTHVEDVCEMLSKSNLILKNVNINEYINQNKNLGIGSKLSLLKKIKSELLNPYNDSRPLFENYSPKNLYFMLNNEYKEFLLPNKIVVAKVLGFKYKKLSEANKSEITPLHNEDTHLWMCSFCKESSFSDMNKVYSHIENYQCKGRMVGVRVLVEGQILGFIPIKYISDEYRVGHDEMIAVNPHERIKQGMVLQCKIKEINFHFKEIILTSRTSDLRYCKSDKDEYFDFATMESTENSKSDSKLPSSIESQDKKLIQRTIFHPKFKNIDFYTVKKLMKDCPVGDFIFRPFRGHTDYIFLTWKVAQPDVFANIQIQEFDKIKETNIGKRLVVDGCLNEAFDDLDEIIDIICSRIYEIISSVSAHKHFKENINGLKDAEKYLIEKKNQEPARVPYILTICHELPGKILLSYLPNRRVNHEYISINAGGFRYREKKFVSLNQLLAWFKENFSNPKTLSKDENSTQKLKIESLLSNPSETNRGKMAKSPEQQDHKSSWVSGSIKSPTKSPNEITSFQNIPPQPSTMPILPPSFINQELIAKTNPTIAVPPNQLPNIIPNPPNLNLNSLFQHALFSQVHPPNMMPFPIPNMPSNMFPVNQNIQQVYHQYFGQNPAPGANFTTQ